MRVATEQGSRVLVGRGTGAVVESSGWASAELSPREVEVLRTWVLRHTKQEVCEDLFLASGTVNTHLIRIREKYRRVGRPAPTKALLLARALQDGYVRLDDL